MIIFFFLLFCWTLLYGEIGLLATWQSLQERLNGGDVFCALLDERLPRAIVLSATGASLSVSGALCQAIFCNPLAGPSVLGVQAGASLCAILAFIFLPYTYYPSLIPLAATFGAFGTLFFVLFLAKSNAHLLLCGIAISTVLASFEGCILYFLRDHWQLMQTLAEWLSGSSFDRSYSHVQMQLPLTLIGLIGAWRLLNEVDIISLGQETALNMGVNVIRIRMLAFFFVACLTGGSIAALGPIAFYSLVLPHILRGFVGAKMKELLPACVLIGATSLLFIDALLRLTAYTALSLGNVCSLFGGLYFLFLLIKKEQPAIAWA